LDGIRPVMAKVVHSVDEERARVGRALKRAVAIVGLDDSEAAALIGIDKSQFSRWVRGVENPILARIYATKLHGPFAIEQARDAESCVVETTVTYRSQA